jgi:preprotein translocase subunit SecG
VIVLFYIAMVIFLLAALALIVLILLHSGKGTGVSEMFGGMLPSTSSGTGIIEKNLDRITVTTAIIWTVCLLIMMIAYPKLG